MVRVKRESALHEVVERVAAAEGVDSEELEPLYWSVDPQVFELITRQNESERRSNSGTRGTPSSSTGSARCPSGGTIQERCIDSGSRVDAMARTADRVDGSNDRGRASLS
jgi:hypothetical protein